MYVHIKDILFLGNWFTGNISIFLPTGQRAQNFALICFIYMPRIKSLQVNMQTWKLPNKSFICGFGQA